MDNMRMTATEIENESKSMRERERSQVKKITRKQGECDPERIIKTDRKANTQKPSQKHEMPFKIEKKNRAKKCQQNKAARKKNATATYAG